MLVNELADPEEDLGLARERDGTPGGEGLPCCLDGAIDLLDGREVDLAGLDTFGGVVDRAPATRRSPDGLPPDPVGDSLQLLRTLCSRRLRDFRHRDLLRPGHPSATSLRVLRIFLAGATCVLGIRLLPLLV